MLKMNLGKTNEKGIRIVISEPYESMDQLPGIRYDKVDDQCQTRRPVVPICPENEISTHRSIFIFIRRIIGRSRREKVRMRKQEKSLVLVRQW